jgi:hypothetical protein
VEWNSLSKEMGRWQVLVNMVMNLMVPQNEGNLLTSCGDIMFPRRKLSMEFVLVL